MNPRLIAFVSMLLLAVGPSHGGQGFESEVREARTVVKSFADSLKGTLMAAMKEEGPVNAVRVCKVDAPRIARESGQASGWTVARTSLKVRNPGNAPDAWEQDVLASFTERMAAGEDPALIEHWEKVDREEGAVLRYMKAIPTGEPCITCHGADLDPELASTIDDLYPEDRARGFEVGELRGAFTLTKTLEE